nr:GNAT family N-acetyltransferase [uncultured Desulfobacter sp.]
MSIETDHNMIFRGFKESDGPELEEILKRNGQFASPAIEGFAAMQRVAACDAAILIVAESHNHACGFIKGVYDGSRALIHLLTIHPKMQNKKIGRALVDEFRKESKKRGATSLSVTVTDQSSGFWKKQGFEVLPVYLMLQNEI